MAELIRDRYSEIEVELIKGGGGAFEVHRDGELIFSKNHAGRFPDDEEIYAALDV